MHYIGQYGIGNASWLEMLWTLTTGLGAVYVFRLFRVALGDYQYVLRENMTSVRRLVVVMMLRLEMVYLYAMWGAWVVGVLSMTQPGKHANNRPTITSVVLTAYLCILALAMTLDARKRIAEYTELAGHEAARDASDHVAARVGGTGVHAHK